MASTTAQPEPLELVVFRYREDVSWSDRWAGCRTLYNKGDDDAGVEGRTLERLDDVGGEGEAYLRHIIRRYPDFADVTVFVQGGVADHCNASMLSSLIEAFEGGRQPADWSGYVGLSRMWGGVTRYEDDRHLGDALPLREACEAVGVVRFPVPPAWTAEEPTPSAEDGTWACNYDNMFAVRRDRLLAHPKESYERLLNDVLLARDPLGGFAVERMWTLMFAA